MPVGCGRIVRLGLESSVMLRHWACFTMACQVVSFLQEEDFIFIVGTEEGTIHKCSTAHRSGYLLSYVGHEMAVYSVQWNKVDPTIFLSSSADWTIKLWHTDSSSVSYSPIIRLGIQHSIVRRPVLLMTLDGCMMMVLCKTFAQHCQAFEFGKDAWSRFKLEALGRKGARSFVSCVCCLRINDRHNIGIIESPWFCPILTGEDQWWKVTKIRTLLLAGSDVLQFG